MLILVRMLMRCWRNSGLDRRHLAEAALAMRDVMSREEEPSFVIKDPRYVKESTNNTFRTCLGSISDCCTESPNKSGGGFFQYGGITEYIFNALVAVFKCRWRSNEWT